MAYKMINVSPETHALVRELAYKKGISMAKLVHRWAEEAERGQLPEVELPKVELNDSYPQDTAAHDEPLEPIL